MPPGLVDNPVRPKEGRIQSPLVEALYNVGVFMAMPPREAGGLEVAPVEWLQFERSQSRDSRNATNRISLITLSYNCHLSWS